MKCVPEAGFSKVSKAASYSVTNAILWNSFIIAVETTGLLELKISKQAVVVLTMTKQLIKIGETDSLIQTICHDLDPVLILHFLKSANRSCSFSACFSLF